MVDKKACKVRKRKYKVNGAVFVTRMSVLLLILVTGITVYNKRPKGGILESSAYIDESSISSMAVGVENGGVYTSSVTPKITNVVKEATLTKDGEKIRFKSGKKISAVGSYILTLEDKEGNVGTIYFDIEM